MRRRKVPGWPVLRSAWTPLPGPDTRIIVVILWYVGVRPTGLLGLCAPRGRLHESGENCCRVAIPLRRRHRPWRAARGGAKPRSRCPVGRRERRRARPCRRPRARGSRASPTPSSSRLAPTRQGIRKTPELQATADVSLASGVRRQRRLKSRRRHAAPSRSTCHGFGPPISLRRRTAPGDMTGLRNLTPDSRTVRSTMEQRRAGDVARELRRALA